MRGLVATKPGGLDIDLGKVTPVYPCLALSCVSLSCQDVTSLWTTGDVPPQFWPHLLTPKSWDAQAHSPVSPVRSLVNLYCYIVSPSVVSLKLL